MYHSLLAAISAILSANSSNAVLDQEFLSCWLARVVLLVLYGLTRVNQSICQLEWEQRWFELSQKNLDHWGDADYVLRNIILPNNHSLFVQFKGMLDLFHVALLSADTVNAFLLQTAQSFNGIDTFCDEQWRRSVSLLGIFGQRSAEYQICIKLHICFFL